MTFISRTFVRSSILLPMVLAALLTPQAASADEELDRLIICAAVFNASFALATNDALKKDYKNQTLRYSQAALERAKELDMTEEGFKQRAAELGGSTTIEEGQLASERGGCLNQAPLGAQ